MEKKQKEEIKSNMQKWLITKDSIEEGFAEMLSEAMYNVYFEVEPLIMADFNVAVREVLQTKEYQRKLKEQAIEFVFTSLANPETAENLWDIEDFQKGITKFVLEALKEMYIRERVRQKQK